MNRRILSMFIVLMICCVSLLSKTSFAEKPISVFIDGLQVGFQIAPINDNGTTLVQFRPIFEDLGFKISWDELTKTVKASKGELNLSLTINSDKAIVNNVSKPLDKVARITKGNTFVPLRFIAEASGVEITWDGKTNHVNIVTDISYYLIQAVITNDLQTMKDMLDKGANPNYVEKNNHNNTPLEWAIEKNNNEAVKLLIKYGANVNQVLKYGGRSNLVDLAIYYNNLDIVKTLVEAGADPNYLDIFGKSPLDDAKAKKSIEIVAYLESNPINKPSETIKSEDLTKVTPKDTIIPLVSNIPSNLISIENLPFKINSDENDVVISMDKYSSTLTGLHVIITIENKSRDKRYMSLGLTLFKIFDGTKELKCKRSDPPIYSDILFFGKSKQQFELFFEPLSDQSKYFTISGDIPSSSHTSKEKFSISLDTHNMLSTNTIVSKIELEEYLIKKYSELETSDGITEFDIKVASGENTEYDYYISVHFDPVFFWQDSLSVKTKEEIKKNMEKMAQDLSTIMPDKKFTGQYEYYFYDYKYIKVGLNDRMYFTWTYKPSEGFKWDGKNDNQL